MRKYLIIFLMLIFPFYTIAGTLTNVGGGYLLHKEAPKKGGFFGKRSLLLGTAVIGGVIIYKYRTDISNTIDRYMSSDKNSYDIKNQLIVKISERINNAKTDEKRYYYIVEAKEALRYYLIKYPDEKAATIARDVAIKTGLWDGDFQNEIRSDQNNYYSVTQKIAKIISAIKADPNYQEPDGHCDKYKDPFSRQYIYNESNPSNEPRVRRLELWDVGSYKDQKKVVKEYAAYHRKIGTNGFKSDGYHKDHIPSQKAVIAFLKNRDNHIPFTSKVVRNVVDNATSVALLSDVHMKGRTFGGKNSTLIPDDSKDLEKATISDFAVYYVYHKGLNLVTPQFETKWLEALTKTYLRNRTMCLFTRR